MLPRERKKIREYMVIRYMETVSTKVYRRWVTHNYKTNKEQRYIKRFVTEINRNDLD